ncbi:hypothetical protein F5884DRAFT_198324 [Xylogone sp. PMI_703]|nr:hypothetical protein F5884DRAFT_198324 [Xylogone sp. PMI_703]
MGPAMCLCSISLTEAESACSYKSCAIRNVWIVAGRSLLAGSFLYAVKFGLIESASPRCTIRKRDKKEKSKREGKTMGSTMRYSAVAAVFSVCMSWLPCAAASAVPELPARTVRAGEPVMSEPTEAPSLELLKARALHLEKRTQVGCSQWSIPGGYGIPACDSPSTCLFYSTTVGGEFMGYEGCGQTSVKYNWVTACYDNSISSGVPPLSQIYCPEESPFCGTFAFVYGDATYYNFGCSTTPYSLNVALISDFTSDGTTATDSNVLIVTSPPATVTVTAVPSPPVRPASSSEDSSSSAEPTSPPLNSSPPRPNPGQNTHHKSNTGAIVGGVVGGVAAIVIAALLAWFFIRRRNKAKQAQADNLASAAAASAASGGAFHSVVANEQTPELAGKPTGGVGYAPVPQDAPVQEKPAVNQQTTEYYKPTGQQPYGHQNQDVHTDVSGAPSPPPVYHSPNPQVPGVPPTSQQFGPQNPHLSELGGTNHGSYQVPQGVSELATPSMSANLAAQPGQHPHSRPQQVDMSGAPMSEVYHHELE